MCPSAPPLLGGRIHSGSAAPRHHGTRLTLAGGGVQGLIHGGDKPYRRHLHTAACGVRTTVTVSRTLTDIKTGRGGRRAVGWRGERSLEARGGGHGV